MNARIRKLSVVLLILAATMITVVNSAFACVGSAGTCP